jgi:hypothetical protein
MKLSSVSVSMAAVAVLAAGVALWPANAQPADGGKPAGGPSPAGEKGAGPRGGYRGGQPVSPWREKLKDELREHPSLGRALLSLHDAKDYLETVKGDLGGHKVSTIASIDASIKEITEAIKFDEKREGGPGNGGGRPNRRPNGDKPADAPKPGDAPAPKP